MAIELGSAYGKIIIDSSGVSKGVEESKKSVMSLKNAFSSFEKSLMGFGGAVTGVAVLVKKALDFGEEGAKLYQTRESFELFMQQIKAAPDLLERLSAATRYTVDDDELMAATMRMLTGTSGELSSQLAANAPALMEIAKASNKLNPTMGDTLSLYEQMSTSIKNLTPRGLKQAGIVVDSAAAYEKYANSIGKSKDALTEEEQSLALMNAVLEKGQTILQQVGGNTESATDKFERAKVAIGEVGDTIKLALLPALGDAATGLNALLGGSKGDVQVVTTAWSNFFNKQIQGGKSAAEIADAYIQKEKEARAAFEGTGEGVDKVVSSILKLTTSEGEYLTDNAGLQQALLLSAKNFDDYWRAIVRANGGNADLIDSNNWVMRTMKAKAQADWDAVKSADAAAEAAANEAKALQKVQQVSLDLVQFGISGALKGALGDYTQGLEDLGKKRQELEEKMRKLGATDFLPALDVKKIAQYQSQLTGLWISINDLIKKRKEHKDFSDEEQTTWDETMDKIGALKYKITELGGVPYLTPDQREELEELRKEYQATGGEAEELQKSLHDATYEIIFQKASAGLDATAMLELGKAMGMLSEEDYAVGQALQNIRKSFDEGKIGPEEYAAQVKAIADAIDRLHSKNIEVTVTTIQNEIMTGGGAGGTGGSGENIVPGGTPGFASGVTNFAVPPGYPNDSFMVGLTSEEILNVLPAGQTTTQSMIVNVPITVYGEADVPMIKQAAYDGANRGTLAAMRERGMR